MGLTPFISSLLLLFALPAFAAYDVNELKLGASEKEVLKSFPGAHCRPLEWPTNAADRRCDDSRIKVANLEGSVTFYLRQDSVEGFDLRFEKAVLPAMGKHFLDRYGSEILPLALKMLRGEQVPPRSFTGHVLVTAKNVFRIYPPIDIN